MIKLYSLAAGTALTFGVYSVTLAYTGNLDIGGSALPVMMHFDAGHTTAPQLDAPAPDASTSTTDHDAAQTTPAKSAAAQPAHDEFQRYFERHYRAHLVLDASSHHFIEVK